MSGKQAVLAVLMVAMSVLRPLASAQDDKNEVTGVVGSMLNPYVRSGNGITFEISYARRLWSSPVLGISGEIPAAFNLDEDLGSGGDVVPKDYQQIFVTPAIRANLFPETAVSPWVSVGGGLAHFSESKDLNYYGTNPGGSSTSGVLEIGLGLDLMPFGGRFKNFGFRAQGRDFWSGAPNLPLADTGESRQHNYFVGAGVIWRFH